MQHEFQPEENQTPLTAKPAAPLAAETEADTQAARRVTERLNAINKNALRTNRLSNIALFGMFVSVLVMKISERLPPSERHIRDIIFNLAFIIDLPLIFLWFATMWGRAPKLNAQELAKIGGVQAIGPLFAALQSPVYRKQKTNILSALVTLLPQMKASDANLLTPAARRIINSWLDSDNFAIGVEPSKEILRISALKALEQVGDSSAILPVEYLTKLGLRTPSAVRVRQAAIECLPMLLANCGEVEAARTLLRASHAEAARPDTLLRPASGAGQTHPQELLRPSDEEAS